MNDEDWMRIALAQAQMAADEGEVPVGAVVVSQAGELLAIGRNRPIVLHDPSAHAEVQALRAAGERVGNYRLPGARLFVTLEPCLMCAGAMFHARLAEVVFGASDPKTGAAGGARDVFGWADLNHQTQVRGGVLAGECGSLLKSFFAQRRSRG
ncbi:MAG: tRNA adenosine(34) deaminase TadA [Betaproteobacteria bacterium]|jgi:tRNA(adenine34) deaminase|nr:tRNA adenosine(34) deaminase TadA [Betaproteobacteria bacterium]